jgi:Animal haem peroxidase
MSKHHDRENYFMVGEQPITGSLLSSPSGCPMHSAVDDKRAFKFGRIFKNSLADSKKPEEEQAADIRALVELGEAMHPLTAIQDTHDSNIPAGYTYLGQFIAHEITFDKTRIRENFPTTIIDDLNDIEQGRTPTIDLDSLYGYGPQEKESSKFYQADGARLRVGTNLQINGSQGLFEHDLPRRDAQDDKPGEPVVPDPRNDENLIIAQLHVALIKFHNKVADQFEKEEKLSGQELFRATQECVIKHFQWIVLHDFLPQIIDQTQLDEAISAPKLFTGEGQMFMPVEFSGAAFRFGHSMVRNSYDVNKIHNAKFYVPVPISQLFALTNFSGGMTVNLPNDWIVDWRHFFDFKETYAPLPKGRLNLANRIDTKFNLRIDKLSAYPHPANPSYRPLMVRNLIRGYALGLPSGQEAANQISEFVKVKRVPQESLAGLPHGFAERTPLWYYILKEAEENGGNQLGDVGSFIVAETFAGILRNSSISILREKEWRPHLKAHRAGHFTMIDLLNYAEAVVPTPIHLKPV